jgi:uncharacterized protein DUF3732
MQRAERKISQFASEALAKLPTVASCVGSELEFSSREPEVAVIEAESGAVLRMPDVGSDQNDLAIFVRGAALLRVGERAGSVPGVLVLDQISRPDFLASGEEEVDEADIAGREEDEDVQAMRLHRDFLFTEAAQRTGLQVLLVCSSPDFVVTTWSPSLCNCVGFCCR